MSMSKVKINQIQIQMLFLIEGKTGSVRQSEVSHTWFWRQIGGRDVSRIRIEPELECPAGSTSPLVTVLPVVVVIWNRMCEVGKRDGTCHHSCNSMQCWLLLLWHSGSDIIRDWMEQIENKKSAVWAGLSLNGHCEGWLCP